MKDRFEYNEAPREFAPPAPHEYSNGASYNEVNAPAAEAVQTPEVEIKTSEANISSPPPQTATMQTSTGTSNKTGTTIMTRLFSVAAAVVGVTVIGTTYVGEARTEQARFTDVAVEPNAIFMEVEVTKWSEDLQIRVSGDGLDEDYYIPVEPPDDHGEEADETADAADAQKPYIRFYEYWFEESEQPRTVTVALIGSKMFMNNVLDSRTVTLTPRIETPPDEPVAGEAALMGVSYLFDPTTAGGRLYADVEVTTWSDALRIALTADDFDETFDLTAPRDGGTTTYFEYLFEQDDNKGLPERVTVTLLGDGDAILDTREAELTEAESALAAIVSASANADGIDVVIDAPVIEGELTIVAEQNGVTVAEYYLTEENERLEDGSGYFEIFITGEIDDTIEEITVFLYDMNGNLLDSTVVTIA